MLDEVKKITLADGREIHLNESVTTLNHGFTTTDNVSVSMISNGVEVYRFPLNDEYSGGTFHLSPSGQYLLFAYYSGQSEELFVLFKIDDMLEVVCDTLDYGEAADYCFTEDETALVQVLPNSCSLWGYWKDDLENMVEPDENGVNFLEFGHINILNIAEKTTKKHQLRVYPSASAKNFAEGYNPFTSPVIIGNVLNLSMPWGKEELPLPLDNVIAFTI